jgi:hypothetical protein
MPAGIFPRPGGKYPVNDAQKWIAKNFFVQIWQFLSPETCLVELENWSAYPGCRNEP